MKNFSDYVDAGIAAMGTGKALAARIGIREKELSSARTGKRGMPERACRELAELIGEPLGAIIAAREAAMAKDPSERKAWERYLANAAGIFGVTIVTSFMTTTPADAAIVRVSKPLNHSLYIMHISADA